MKIISMVPSWTETLIEAGVEVVGRTRFCIHPSEKIKNIPVVGGTKNIDWSKVAALSCDLLLIDREENPKSFYDDAKCETLVTHVRSCENVAAELRKIAARVKINIASQNLLSYAKRWESVISKSKESWPNKLLQLQELSDSNQKSLGLIEWIQKPAETYDQIVYVIWKDPYMAVAHETFIGSVLDLVGLQTSVKEKIFGKLYPEIEIEKFDREKTLFLFSSEPYPFHKKKSEIKQLGVPAAIVDGECFSWFGLRSLKFLESI